MKKDLSPLTKEQRNQIYKTILRTFLRDRRYNYDYGICVYLVFELKYHCKHDDSKKFSETIFIHFPEFARKKPFWRRRDRFWWNIKNVKSRVKALEECIEETK
jgi:hypothetical protein